MAHHVYANGSEIASPSSSGSSAGAAPDVCMSPPGPKAGPVPIPYSNTCKHSDLDNLAGTVFVGGAGMALEDKSFFSTSYGNEPATNSYSKGVVSGKIKGKCYFQSWSMNVKAEGLGVDRHMDIITHNHSNPGNTPAVIYKSRKFDSSVCKEDRIKVKKGCKSKKQDEKENAKKARGKRGGLAAAFSGLSDRIDQIGIRASKYKASRKNGNLWIEDYCDGLWVNSGGKLTEDVTKEVEDYKKELKDLNNKIQDMDKNDLVRYILDEAIGQVPDEMLRKELTEMAVKALAKAGIGVATAGTGVGLIVTAFLWAWTAYDIYQFQNKLTEILGDAAGEYVEMMLDTDKLKAKLQEQIEAVEGEDTTNKVLAKLQELKAKSNPCIKARKCQLTSFDNSKKVNGNKSCCPGQTGHHLLPDSMFRSLDPAKQEIALQEWKDSNKAALDKPAKDPSKQKTPEEIALKKAEIDKTTYKDLDRKDQAVKDCWDGYSEGGSLTICAEGGAWAGSHGMLHKQTERAVIDLHSGGKSEIKYTSVRDKLVNLVNKKYGCNRKCLEAQLDEYYGKAYTCPDGLENAKVVAHTGKSNGALTAPTRETTRPKQI